MKKNLFFILFFSLLINFSCKKSSAVNNQLLEQYFETNFLNRAFIVTLAQDTGVDITSEYSGYVFVLLKADNYHGPLTAKANGTVYNGTWSSNSDYSKLTIALPSTPAPFIFLTRDWRFTSKNIPTLELAPWGSNAAIVLHMYRQ
jgi:hypothetical protein